MPGPEPEDSVGAGTFITALALALAAWLPPAAAHAKDQGAAPPGQVKKQVSAPAAAPSAPGKPSPGRARHARGAAPGQSRSARPAAAPAAATPVPARAGRARTARRGHAGGRRAHAATAGHRAALQRAAARRRRVAAHRVAAAAVTHAPGASVAPSHPGPAPRPVKERLQAGAHHGAIALVTRAAGDVVRDVVSVVPSWVKPLIAALAALLGLAALLIAAGVLRNRRLRRQRAALAEQVGVLQAALLPDVPDHLGALSVSVAYRPAEGLAAGGDFYDVFPVDEGRVGIVVGDVSGHGREALGPATSIRHMIRAYLEAGLAPRAALQLAARIVDEQRRDDFATVVAAVHDSAAGTLSYATAGHPPPIITGAAAHRPLTVASSPPLGVGSPTGLRQTIVPLPPGSTVCFFTDGLIEARTPTGPYGVDRVEQVGKELDTGATAQDVINRVARGSAHLPDDVAVCLVRAEPDAAAGILRVEEIEVTPADLDSARLRRFLEECGFDAGDIDGVVSAAAPQVRAHGSAVLRVRLADDRSGVDLLPATPAPPAELARALN